MRRFFVFSAFALGLVVLAQAASAPDASAAPGAQEPQQRVVVFESFGRKT